jgi:hypothetical protein
MAGSAREEAERLVATILAMAGGGDQNPDPDPDPGRTREQPGLVGMVTGLASGHGWSTGSAECCVCPVCRAIAAVRDPSPEATERVATGAGDVAMGMASLMRGFSAMARSRPAPRRAAPAKAPKPGNADETWSAATRRNDAAGAWSAATNNAATNNAAADTAAADTTDSWSAATTASAAAADAEAEVNRAAAQRAAAKAAADRAAAAAERVTQAVALAEAARAAAGTDGFPARGRTVGGFDVWAAATAEPATVDHDGPGASAPEDRGGAVGDEARDGDPV